MNIIASDHGGPLEDHRVFWNSTCSSTFHPVTVESTKFSHSAETPQNKDNVSSQLDSRYCFGHLKTFSTFFPSTPEAVPIPLETSRGATLSRPVTSRRVRWLCDPATGCLWEGTGFFEEAFICFPVADGKERPGSFEVCQQCAGKGREGREGKEEGQLTQLHASPIKYYS